MRCLINTGLPLHLTVRVEPTGILLISNSAEAKASTSAEALILDTNYIDRTFNDDDDNDDAQTSTLMMIQTNTIMMMIHKHQQVFYQPRIVIHDKVIP